MIILPLALLVAVAHSQPAFNWSAITPSPKLEYHDCSGFKCARLQVPLDWTNPHDMENPVAIAIVTLPATVPASDPSFGGTVLFNPGGPGQSGTTSALALLPYLRDLLQGERNYELMTFDPRGVFRTTPGMSCYSDDLVETLNVVQAQGIGRIAADLDNLQSHYVAYGAESKLCEESAAHILPHMSTAAVARDLIEIVDRVEELRHPPSNSTLGYNASKPKLQLIGASYGTALGQYFAAMFPDRVGKLYLDGVLDIEDYTQNYFRKAFTDGESTLNFFYQACFNSNLCPLRNANDSDWRAIKQRVDGFLTQVDASPVTTIVNGSISLHSSSQFRLHIVKNLYTPIRQHMILANDLVDFFAGNYTALNAGASGSQSPSLSFAPPNTSVPSTFTSALDAQVAITCLDAAPDVSSRDASYYNEYLRFIQQQAPSIVNGLYPSRTFGCVGRTIRPEYNFEGPFTMPAQLHNGTSPILFASAELDPVTPLPNAYAMTHQYPGSVAFSQKGSGHTAIFNQPSACTRDVIRAYFDRGVLPQNGTVCEAQCTPWKECIPVVDDPSVPA